MDQLTKKLPYPEDEAPLTRNDTAVPNRDTPGMSVCWWVLPKGRDAKRLVADLEAGKLSAEEVARYTAEVRRLFNKRAYSMDPSLDARLSFTTDIGYRPHRHSSRRGRPSSSTPRPTR